MPSFNFPPNLPTVQLARALIQLAQILDSAVLQQAGDRLYRQEQRIAELERELREARGNG